MSAQNKKVKPSIEEKLGVVACLLIVFSIAAIFMMFFVRAGNSKFPTINEILKANGISIVDEQDSTIAENSKLKKIIDFGKQKNDEFSESQFSEYYEAVLAHQNMLLAERERQEKDLTGDANALASKLIQNLQNMKFVEREQEDANVSREKKSKTEISKDYSNYEMENLVRDIENDVENTRALEFSELVENEIKKLDKFSENQTPQTENILSRANIFQKLKKNADSAPSVFEKNDIVAFYGNPRSAAMGILGQYSLEDLEPKLLEFAASYDVANGARKIIPCLYLVYGTCWKQGEIGYLDDETVERYIEFAEDRKWLVVLDHQLGKYSIKTALTTMLPFLQHENVHLALDPEWKTTNPMEEIGSIAAQEINEAQQMVDEYLRENNLAGKRFLIIHQFTPKMISDADEILNDGEYCELVHSMDGFGPPNLKRESYAHNSTVSKIPLKSFKLFSSPAIKEAGYDSPMMTPEEVLNLNPKPVFIIMQ